MFIRIQILELISNNAKTRKIVSFNVKLILLLSLRRRLSGKSYVQTEVSGEFRAQQEPIKQSLPG